MSVPGNLMPKSMPCAQRVRRHAVQPPMSLWNHAVITAGTPPCADALIAAGVIRVVVAVQDPDPQVAGQGIAKLRAAGIEVECGMMEAAARELNSGFFHA